MERLVAVEALNPNHDKLTRFLWFTGLRCNLNCSYCDHHDQISPYLSVEMVKSAIQHIRANFSDRYLEMVLTGGEPALNPDFLEILRILKEDGGVHYLGTMTNGMRPLEFFVEAMNWLDIMIISYQLENPQREKVLEVIEGLHRQLNHKFGENKRWIHVQVMVVPGELDHVRQVADRLRKLDIPVTLRRVRPLLHRSSLGTSPQFVKPYENPLIDGHQDPDLIFDEDVPVDYYSAEELQILEDWDREWGGVANFNQVESVYEVREGSNIRFERRPQNVNDFLMRGENNYQDWLCWAGNQSIYIDEKGNVFAGSCRVKKMGHINNGFTIEESPLICTPGWCRCGTDLKVTRFHPDFADQVRLSKK